jgi:GDP/UDP-N,N'-diacetylbacillosamine 2-epimerase (hydrolysing)
LLGDRFEIFAAATAACVARIPIAHCHGGELTVGAIDDAFRHSITKMSHLHFTSTDVYRNRIIQLGEYPDKIFNVGALGIENIRRLPLLSKHSFEESIDFKLKEKNLLITFHPVTLEVGTSEYQIQELLKVLKDLGETGLIFTLPNSDTDSRVVINKIRQFVKDNPNNSVVFESLGQLRYLSALNFVDAVVGNSSSGIIEAPSFKIGTVNIGDRQSGRLKAGSVVDCKPYHADISNSLMKVYSNEFKIMLKSIVNPYDKGDSSKSICSILKNISLGDLLKKEFHDIPY